MVTFDVVNVTAQTAQFAHFSPNDIDNSKPLATTNEGFPKQGTSVCKVHKDKQNKSMTNLDPSGLRFRGTVLNATGRCMFACTGDVHTTFGRLFLLAEFQVDRYYKALISAQPELVNLRTRQQTGKDNGESLHQKWKIKSRMLRTVGQTRGRWQMKNTLIN